MFSNSNLRVSHRKTNALNFQKIHLLQNTTAVRDELLSDAFCVSVQVFTPRDVKLTAQYFLGRAGAFAFLLVGLEAVEECLRDAANGTEGGAVWE